MEESLFSFLWIAVLAVFIVTNAANSAKRRQKKSDGVPPVTAKPVPPPKSIAPPKRVDIPAAKPEARPIGPAGAAPRMEQTTMLPPPEDREGRQPGRVAQPQVHAHLAPDCDEHEDEGSLHYQSTEGVDPCHDDELPDRHTPRPAVQPPREQPGLTLEWTGDALVKSVVMQEILTRPCQRRHVRR